jgi:hypothetical protein
MIIDWHTWKERNDSFFTTNLDIFISGDCSSQIKKVLGRRPKCTKVVKLKMNKAERSTVARTTEGRRGVEDA